MKKYNLLKILAIVLGVYFVLTWIIPASYYSNGLQYMLEGTKKLTYPMGIPQLFQLPVETLSYFVSTFIFILSVGGLYGVLEATGVYRKFLDKIVEKTKKRKLLVLLLVMSVIAIISSVVGLELGMFAIFPLLISLILLMGYDKLTALAATLGATIVGMFGSTFSYTMYGIVNSYASTSMTDGILIKVILFVVALGLLIGLTLLHLKSKSVKSKEKGKKTKDAKIEETDLLIPAADSKNKKKLWPIAVIFGIYLLIMILGTINWSEAFKVEWFNDVYTALMSFKIGNFAIFGSLFSGIKAFGEWFNPSNLSRFNSYTVLIIITTISLAIIYKVKLDDYLESFFKGARKNLKIAALITFAYTILLVVSSFPIFLTITEFITGGKFNVATSGIATLLGSGLYVDMYYFPQYVFEYLLQLENADASILSVLFVSMYSLAMLVVPTSALLIASLRSTETSYKDWIKFIWKLFVALLMVAFIVLAIFVII